MVSPSLHRFEQSFNLGPLGGGRWKPSQQVAGGRGGLRPAAGFGVRDREIESSLVKVGVDFEGCLQRLDGVRHAAPGGLKDAEVRGHDRIVRFSLPGFVERPLGAGEVVAAPETRGQTEVRVCGRQAAVDGGGEFMLGAWAVTRLQQDITETQVRLAVGCVDGQNLLQRRPERGA